jgi:hypothetical protein
MVRYLLARQQRSLPGIRRQPINGEPIPEQTQVTPCRPGDTVSPIPPALCRTPADTVPPDSKAFDSKPDDSTERGTFLSPRNARTYTQSDFDARDPRKMSGAYEELDRMRAASIGGGSNWTAKRTSEWVCERVGITVQRGLELEALQKKWPEQVPEWAKGTGGAG